MSFELCTRVILSLASPLHACMLINQNRQDIKETDRCSNRAVRGLGVSEGAGPPMIRYSFAFVRHWFQGVVKP